MLLLLAAATPRGAFGQVQPVFTGAARTQVQYLQQNSSVLSGATDSASLWRIRQELVNLPALRDATFHVHNDTITGATSVRWELEESRSRFPLLDFGGLRGNLTFLLGYKDINWRGLGHEITAYYQNNDGRHNFLLAFRNPGIRGGRWGYGGELRRYASEEPLYFTGSSTNYHYANTNFGASVSYQLGTGHYLSLGLTAFREVYAKLPGQESRPGPAGLTEDKGLLKIYHDLDRRDFIGARRSGFRHTTNVQAVLTHGRTGAFLSVWHDWRYYRLAGRWGNLAARLRAGVATNDLGPFAPFVLDSQVNIRGSGNRIDRGTAQLVLNLEYRHILYRDRRDRFVVQSVAFSDLGTWRNPGGSLEDLVENDNIRHFVGGGLRLASLRTASSVLRVDYGFSPRTGVRGLVFGLGHYF